MKYNEIFDIEKTIVGETKKLIKIFFKDIPKEEKANGILEWATKVSKIHGVPVPRIVMLTDHFLSTDEGKMVSAFMSMVTGGGVHMPGLRLIIINRHSITTLLHEYRHHLQHYIKHDQLPDGALFKDDIEEDARAWSHSLFFAAAPKMYRKAAERGMLLH